MADGFENRLRAKEAKALFGDITAYASTVTAFFGKDGQVKEAEISQVDHFKPVAGTEKKIKADLVVLAMGFTGAEQWLLINLASLPKMITSRPMTRKSMWPVIAVAVQV